MLEPDNLTSFIIVNRTSREVHFDSYKTEDERTDIEIERAIFLRWPVSPRSYPAATYYPDNNLNDPRLTSAWYPAYRSWSAIDRDPSLEYIISHLSARPPKSTSFNTKVLLFFFFFLVSQSNIRFSWIKFFLTTITHFANGRSVANYFSNISFHPRVHLCVCFFYFSTIHLF